MKHLLNLSTVALILASGVTTAEVMPVESSASRSHYDSWNETKQNLQKEHGLQLGMDYNMLSMGAIEPLGDSSAAAGALRVFGQWDLLETEDGDKGGIVFKFEHRHKYTENSPKEYGLADLGYLGFAHSLYGDQGFRTTHLFWRQSLMQEQMVVYQLQIHSIDF